MKFLVSVFILVQAVLLARGAGAQVTSWDNSPMNYQNSPMNYNSTNGVYDNTGNRIGYVVQSPQGVTNIFDNNGNRVGYFPSKKQ